MKDIHYPLTIENFEVEEDLFDLVLYDNGERGFNDFGWAINDVITSCNDLLLKYEETGDERYLEAFWQIVPASLKE